jgi:hypothetical protein
MQDVAELFVMATRKDLRRQGNCRRLVGVHPMAQVDLTWWCWMTGRHFQLHVASV